MRRVSILIAALALSTVTACAHDRVPLPTVPPRPPVYVNPDPCGDGTQLRPGQHCP